MRLTQEEIFDYMNLSRERNVGKVEDGYEKLGKVAEQCAEVRLKIVFYDCRFPRRQEESKSAFVVEKR